jgi:hypothetical protein
MGDHTPGCVEVKAHEGRFAACADESFGGFGIDNWGLHASVDWHGFEPLVHASMNP